MSLRASGTWIFNFCVSFRNHLLALFLCMCMVMTVTNIKTWILGDCDQIRGFFVNTLLVVYNNLCWAVLTPSRGKEDTCGTKILDKRSAGLMWLAGLSWEEMEKIPLEKPLGILMSSMCQSLLYLCTHSNPKKHKTKTFKMSRWKKKSKIWLPSTFKSQRNFHRHQSSNL